jgi:hypothetical protein
MKIRPLMVVPGFLLFLGLLALVGSLSPTGAYQQYSDGSASVYCAQCHELAVGGFQSRGPLHDAHVASATSTCQLCHTQNGDIPQMTSSGATGGKGCMGCHGQVIGGVTTGIGLRAHHVAKGVIDADGMSCADCHSDGPAAPESSAPAYYGQADVVQTNACNTDGKEDFWNRDTGLPDGKGLDNDGDLLVDAADTDCQASCVDPDGDGYGDPGDPSCLHGAARDCDNTRNTVYPGAPEIYDTFDNDCNGEIDEIKNAGFMDPAARNRFSWDQQNPPGQVYDVVRSDGAQFPVASPNTTCLANNTTALFVDDLVAVPVGKVFYYLVRNNLVNNYGKRTDGSLNSYTICP